MSWALADTPLSRLFDSICRMLAFQKGRRVNKNPFRDVPILSFLPINISVRSSLEITTDHRAQTARSPFNGSPSLDLPKRPQNPVL